MAYAERRALGTCTSSATDVTAREFEAWVDWNDNVVDVDNLCSPEVIAELFADKARPSRPGRADSTSIGHRIARGPELFETEHMSQYTPQCVSVM